MQIVDRPTQSHVFLSREYVQPQWVFDCVNARIILPTEGYLVGRYVISAWNQQNLHIVIIAFSMMYETYRIAKFCYPAATRYLPVAALCCYPWNLLAATANTYYVLHEYKWLKSNFLSSTKFMGKNSLRCQMRIMRSMYEIFFTVCFFDVVDFNILL